MKHINSIDRDQIQFTSLNIMVEEDSMVRLLDVFLDFVDNQDLGFQGSKQVTGRPAFPKRTLLGIYIYGYLNRIRSSRALEKACLINVELMWLLKGHKPCYKTIANFRKDNRLAFGKLFKLYRNFCINLDLYGKEEYNEQCVSKGNRKSSQGRYIDRYLIDKAVQSNKRNVDQNKALYKKRQAIVEHPFGTIKRAWGFTHTLMRTQPKVETEFSLIMLCYNLRRTMSILGIEVLKKALKRAFYPILTMRAYMQPQSIKLFLVCHLHSPSL